MPTIAEQLTQLISDRDDLVSNLTTKGISGLTGDETFTELVPEVLNIPSGGGGRDWTEIGYSSEPEAINVGVNYAKEIMRTWNNSTTSMSNKFKNDYKIMFMPLVVTTNVTNMSNAFNTCRSLITVADLDTANVTNMSNMFTSAYALYSLPNIDTSKVTTFNNFCSGCTGLRKTPQLKADSAVVVSNIFNLCSSLEISGGLKDLGKAYLTSAAANNSSYKLELKYCNLLTHDSLMNFINGLYDIATKGCNSQQLILDTTNLAKLTAQEIAIATNKGWTVS